MLEIISSLNHFIALFRIHDAKRWEMEALQTMKRNSWFEFQINRFRFFFCGNRRPSEYIVHKMPSQIQFHLFLVTQKILIHSYKNKSALNKYIQSRGAGDESTTKT